ncbi:alcohol dehydrogenase catalytic domain-containing protein [Micromonospora sp. WMMD1102]|uniref:alcohol dehydrogenase catalytic domain-containing protein n=1 Tax=Micromonospora sp. WMMD1102 TaxID=3016105 RepID=UPI0024158796|nr:alcohol dehydrogenase catalytic domain-containing protein [Micromonospora sp. WMMD1102]MDG4789067.1 alcohol dehydrogenase catalytic domain-containing protein [Micromonospora sp. WMMD1102]
MKALCWQGPDRLAVERVPDPRIVDAQDAIVRVRQSLTCGSDLHLIAGRFLETQPGDVLGHEFVGEVVEIGAEVRRHAVGDRVVVCSVVACGRCWYCRHGLFSCCDNGNPNPELAELAWAAVPAGCFGYSHALGGFAGSHAEYVRVPYADHGAFRIPDEVSDDRAVFASDSAPAGWLGAELGDVRPGDVVAIWGAGAVGQLAARAAVLRGADRVICVDLLDDRLAMAEREVGVETVNCLRVDAGAELRDRTGGRGADVCVEAVGMAPPALGSPVPGPLGPTASPSSAGSPGSPGSAGSAGSAGRGKRRVRSGADPPGCVADAVHACRKGGTVVVLGIFAGHVDAFPLGAVLHKGLTVRAARQHGQRHVPELLARMRRDELWPEYLITHRLSLDDAPHGYALFRDRVEGCVRVAFTPEASPRPG